MINQCKYILFLLFLAYQQNANSQKDTITTIKMWGQAGVFTDKLGFQLGINYNINKHFLCIKYYENAEWDFNFSGNKKLNTIADIRNVSIMYFFHPLQNKHFKLIPMAGLSLGQGSWRTDKVDKVLISSGNPLSPLSFSSYSYTYYYEKFQYVGAQFGLNFLWTPTKYFGLGLEVFKNFHLHSDDGIVISLVFGKLR